ncbi:unnamed protein product [Penicillium manginii]
MDVWIAAFAYDELSGLVDAGVLFYQMDFWSLWNLGIIGVGFAFIIARMAFCITGAHEELDLTQAQDLLAREPEFILRQPSEWRHALTYLAPLIAPANRS